MMTKTCIGFALAFLVIVQLASAEAMLPLVPYVNDFSAILDSTCVSQLNDIAAKVEANSTAQIYVVTIPTISGIDIENFTTALYLQNNISHNYESVLILLVTDDMKYRVHVSSGLHETLPDDYVRNVTQIYLVPNFKEGGYCLALTQTMNALGDTIMNEGKQCATASSCTTTEVIQPTGIQDNLMLWTSISIVIIVFMGAVYLIGRKKNKGKVDSNEHQETRKGSLRI